MTPEEAIQTALEYEVRIRDLYRDYAEKMTDPVGKRIFKSLGEDEEKHVAYLTDRLKQWKETGRLSVEALQTAIPSREVIEREMGKLETRMSREDRKNEKQMLSKALAVEVETSNIYRKLVDEMSDDWQRMFARFLEIEDGHIGVVQAELDWISHTGYWLDFKEFDME